MEEQIERLESLREIERRNRMSAHWLHRHAYLCLGMRKKDDEITENDLFCFFFFGALLSVRLPPFSERPGYHLQRTWRPPRFTCVWLCFYTKHHTFLGADNNKM